MAESLVSARSCFNGGTTMWFPLEEDFRATAAAGYQAIEIWYEKLTAYMQDHSVADLARMVRRSGLDVAGICALSIRFGDEATSSRQAVAQTAAWASEIGAPPLVVLLGRSPGGLPTADARDLAAGGLAEAAAVADPYGIALAIEWTGPRAIMPLPGDAIEIASLARVESVGVVIDTFHLYRAGVSLAEIGAIPADKLRIVHVNDAEDRSRNDVTDWHRLFPTLGVIPAAKMVRTVLASGYRGYFSVEVFRHEFEQWPIDEIVGQSKHYLDRLLREEVTT